MFGSNLSMSSVDLWMVSWCWASLHKLSHSSDFSLHKKRKKDLALTLQCPTKIHQRSDLLVSQDSFTLLIFLFCTRQWCKTVFHQWIFSLQLTTLSGSLTSGHSSLQCPIYCRHNENCSVEINRTQGSHGAEKKGQMTTVIMLKESVCLCIMCGWSSEHACDFNVCLVCVCVLNSSCKRCSYRFFGNWCVYIWSVWTN